MSAIEAEQLPYLLQVTEQALGLGDTLLLPSPQLSPQVRASAAPIAVERTLFAYRIPHLPDFLSSPHLTGQTQREKIAEILDRQTRLVANLDKWKEMGFALRYHSNPERGAVDIAFVARGLAHTGRGQKLGEQMASDVAALLQSNELPIESVADENTLKEILQPFPRAQILEIRQRERVVSLKLGGEAYVVYPFRPALSTWIPSFSTLLHQRAPCAISIYLEPTHFYEEEQQSFAEAAALAETLADFNFQGLAYQGRIADPQARIVARLYSNLLQRLTDPFLLVVQISSPDPMTARAIAQTIAAEMTESNEFSADTSDNAPLPSGFDILAPQTPAETQAAWRMMTALDWQMWGVTDATPGKERLRYLVDARGASAAFRFPIAMQGGIPGVKTRQLLPTQQVGASQTQVAADHIALGNFEGQSGIASVPLNVFTRHALIAGTTGSGKTTTCLHLLTELWKKGTPFLVIDPAKTEYRALIESPIGKDMQIFTLGDESVSPFRMNPLEILPGVRVEAHVSALRACFEASLPTFGILPSLIEESLLNVYQNKGWNLTDRGKASEVRLMPVLGELYREIIRVTEERGYQDKTLQDIRAAAAGRIGSLLRGSKGRMLNTRHSIPMEALMTRPTLLELEHLNDEEKSLVMLFLLMRVREHTRVTRAESKLAHVTVIEEAHRLAAQVPHVANGETKADTRASGAESLSMTLSEIRAYGEGIIIAEQIPSRLIADALKNTNIKIVHRLPGKDDREAIGGTMNLGAEQESYLSKLPPGQAAFFTEGFEKPAFITVPNPRAQYNLPERVSEERVEQAMARFHAEHCAIYLPFGGCRYCQKQCVYRDRVAPVAYELQAGKKFKQALYAFEQEKKKGDESAAWCALAQGCASELPGGLKSDQHAVFCYFAHLWEGNVSEGAAEKLRREMRAIR